MNIQALHPLPGCNLDTIHWLLFDTRLTWDELMNEFRRHNLYTLSLEDYKLVIVIFDSKLYVFIKKLGVSYWGAFGLTDVCFYTKVITMHAFDEVFQATLGGLRNLNHYFAMIDVPIPEQENISWILRTGESLLDFPRIENHGVYLLNA